VSLLARPASEVAGLHGDYRLALNSPRLRAPVIYVIENRTPDKYMDASYHD